MNRRFATTTTGLLVVSAAVALAASGEDLPYEHAYQQHVGGWSAFNVEGSATGDYPDVEGDAFVLSVDFPNGERSEYFYKPIAIHDISYTGDFNKFLVRGGANVTEGFSGNHYWGSADGNMDDATPADIEAFRADMITALSNNNLNNYVDSGFDSEWFEFTIEFDKMVRDNDPEPDDFGEILYFERGAGSGNSWLKMQAVDEHGNALGPWLVIGPNETVQTTPVTTVLNSTQLFGTTSIDVSRLGVSEFKYLKVTNNVVDEPAYTGGGDTNPDFKIMAVITDRKVRMIDSMNLYD